MTRAGTRLYRRLVLSYYDSDPSGIVMVMVRMMSILTHSLLPALSIHIRLFFHLPSPSFLPPLSHYTLIVIQR